MEIMTGHHNLTSNVSERKEVCSTTGNGKKESEHRCATCKKPAASLRCSACLLVYYCNKKHQVEDWPKHKGWCRGFEVSDRNPVELLPVLSVQKVRTTAEVGPHLIATRDYKKDDVILTETPFLIGPPKYKTVADICVGCCRSLDLLTRAVCQRCKWPICNSRCPGLHRSNHAAECEILSRCRQRNGLPELLRIKMNMCLLALRCLLLRNVNPDKWKWMEMMFPFAQSKIVNPLLRLEEATFLPLIVDSQDLPVSTDVVLNVLAVLDVYSLSWRCDKRRLVSALSTNASLLQQSCCPNTRVNYEDSPEICNAAKSGIMGRITIRALKDISKGEVLSFMFMEQLSRNSLRRAQLIHMKNIKCSCARCLDPRELGTDFSTLKCTRCSGWVLASEPCSELVDWKCQSCGVIVQAHVVEDRLDKLREKVEVFSDLDEAGRAVNIRQVGILQSLLDTYLHPNHQFCYNLKTVMMRHIGSSPGLAGIPKLGDGYLEKKAELCRQLIELADKLGISFSGAEEFLPGVWATLAKSRAEILKRKFARREVTKEQAVKDVKECRALLRRAVKLITLPNVLDMDEFREVASVQYVSEDLAILAWANENGLNLAVE